MLFFQCYPNFRRFDCKVFLTEALRFMGGATTRVMIDNTHVVVLRGSGRDMVPVPEMAAFGERFGFKFVAHAIGNANRSGRGEGPFPFFEGNFLPGGTSSGCGGTTHPAAGWGGKGRGGAWGRECQSRGRSGVGRICGGVEAGEP